MIRIALLLSLRIPIRTPLVTTLARCGDPGRGGAVSVGPIWHACIAIRPAKHRSLLGFKLIPECATLDSRVSDQGRICDFIY